ncbi:MAG: alpha/beta fold hydrolase [Candidatus Heimdallarchaeota archaeon]
MGLKVWQKRSKWTQKIFKRNHESLELQVTEEQQLKIDQLIDSTRKKGVTYWDKKITKEIFVPVDDGEIRILHVKPEKPKNKRIILFIPGWGVIADGFRDLYEGLFDSVEFYYIETREKGSSKINSVRKADMSISQNAKDIQSTINYLGLQNTDFVLAGPCWGATIQLLGLLEKTLDAPTIIVFDPMHKLWFNRFLLDIAPIVPAFLVNWLKPLFKWVLFGNSL